MTLNTLTRLEMSKNVAGLNMTNHKVNSYDRIFAVQD